MKQIVQHLRDGKITVEKVTPPVLQAGGVLVKNVASLISAGTEKSKVEVGKKSYLGKARSRPEDVKRVVAEIKKEGLMTTYKKVMNRLNQPSTLGYSSAGIVLEVSDGVTDLRPGDPVACAGAEYAVHADIVFVPRNLCAAIPDGVTFKRAAFTTVGSIALQGLRQTAPTLGETILVIGLGLVGQLLVQML
ncbi:MAG: zinc-binding alcohol dehydrogenase, partial [Bacteroidetes bacterium]|nr:zinc-binding alcohol dehydrogenase [Bacteroidota bacterium]